MRELKLLKTPNNQFKFTQLLIELELDAWPDSRATVFKSALNHVAPTRWQMLSTMRQMVIESKHHRDMRLQLFGTFPVLLICILKITLLL